MIKYIIQYSIMKNHIFMIYNNKLTKKYRDTRLLHQNSYFSLILSFGFLKIFSKILGTLILDLFKI
jgi:hypothetical protein